MTTLLLFCLFSSCFRLILFYMMQTERLNIIAVVTSVLQEIIDTSSSESDDEFKVLETVEKKRDVRVQNYAESIVPKFSDHQFKAHFRMCTETFNYILSVIEPKLRRHAVGKPMICPRKQFLLTLWRVGTPDSLRSICDRFDVSKSTGLSATRRVINALVELAPVFIKWPTIEDLNTTWSRFEATSGFPKIIGAIDGTHINIPAPKQNPEAYVNRKGHHSIQLQAICDASCRFIHCYTGHVGSVHDQRIFRQSEVQSYLGDISKFPDDCHLVGDLAYKLHDNLLIPYRDNGHLTERQKNYNFCHASGRIAIERAFGLLKGRFRSLLNVLPLERVDLIPRHIIACCVLHNICLLKGDELEIQFQEPILDIPEETHHVYQNQSHRGAIKRDLICERLIIRRL